MGLDYMHFLFYLSFLFSSLKSFEILMYVPESIKRVTSPPVINILELIFLL